MTRGADEWRRQMTTKRTCWAAAVFLVVGAIAVYVAMLPDEYDCDPSPLPGITSLEGRNFTCAEAAEVIKALFHGEGHPVRDSRVLVVRGWRCLEGGGLIHCTRGHNRWLQAHYALRD
jgi:hypothetical protein